MRPAIDVTIAEDRSFREAVTLINKRRSGIALVTDNGNGLAGVLTDGDIRRAILKGVSLDEPVRNAMVRMPATVPLDCTRGEIFRLFVEKKISHLPVVDEGNNILGIYYESDFRKEGVMDIPVVIMAGGFGRRLRPHTDKVPKPMLKIGGKPLLDILIDKFRDIGVSDFYITVNYLAEIIEEHLWANNNMKANIKIIKENKPLGTAGSLRLLSHHIKTEFLLTNADIMTNFDFKDMHNFHVRRGADLTVAVKRYDFQVPFGAVNIVNERLIGLSEKPELNVYINAGVYILNPDLIREVPEDTFFDMTDLIDKLLKAGRKIFSYSIDGTWIDIGRPADYELASKEFKAMNSSDTGKIDFCDGCKV
jgi:dTDP-glucose pyrophosphorylase